MKYLYLSLLTLCTATTLSAKEVNVEEARRVASDYLRLSNTQTRSAASELQLVWSGEETATRSSGAPAFYLFNDNEANSFVIVSGDDATQPILAYGNEAIPSPEQMPDNLRYLLDSYATQINLLRAQNIDNSANLAQAWSEPRSAEGETVKLYETALWDQMAPYNGMTGSPTGCVATAAAIIMKHHSYPEKGDGRCTYSYYNANYQLITVSTRFAVTNHWDDMLPVYKEGEYTTEQADAVQGLMYRSAVLSETMFGTYESAAFVNTAVGGLITYMKYDQGASVEQSNWYTNDEWHTLLQNELNERPILYGGVSKEGVGHQFVLDGYSSNDYYHVNWGWSGLGNGFFLLSVLQPEIPGVGGGEVGGYTIEQTAAIGIKPLDAANPSTFVDRLVIEETDGSGRLYNGLVSSTKEIEEHAGFNLTVGFVTNVGVRAFHGSVAAWLVDSKGVKKEQIGEKIFKYSPDNLLNEAMPLRAGGQITIEARIEESTIANGDRIEIYAQHADGGELFPVKVRRLGCELPSAIVLGDLSGVEENTVDSQTLQAYFQSATGELMVNASAPLLSVEVYSANGALVANQMVNSSANCIALAANHYPKGIYIVKAITTQGSAVCRVAL